MKMGGALAISHGGAVRGLYPKLVIIRIILTPFELVLETVFRRNAAMSQGAGCQGHP